MAALVFAAAYSNSLENAFAFDDVHVVQQNLFIRDLANVPRFFVDARTFSSLPQNATYRPLVSTTLAIDYAIAHGLALPAYHVTQLILLALVGNRPQTLSLKEMLQEFLRHRIDVVRRRTEFLLAAVESKLPRVMGRRDRGGIGQVNGRQATCQRATRGRTLFAST